MRLWQSRTWATFTVTVAPLSKTIFVAPIELIGFARSKAQRHKRCSGCLPAFLSPTPSIAAHGVVAAVISALAQLLEQPDQRQTLT